MPFETVIDGISVRGRMDAVYAEADGGWTVVDWKTGALPDPARRPALNVQLAAYRMAWAALAGCPPERVRAAFHYVRHDVTLRPVDLLDADGLRALLASVPRGRLTQVMTEQPGPARCLSGARLPVGVDRSGQCTSALAASAPVSDLTSISATFFAFGRSLLSTVPR